MSTLHVVHPEPTETDGTLDAVIERRLDGLATFLRMLGRVSSPAGAWSAGPSQADAAMLDVLRVTAAAMPHARAVTVAQLRGGKASTVVATDRVGQEADVVQHAGRQGPSIDAVLGERPCITADLSLDERWPRLSALAAGVPVRSAMCVPLADSGLTGSVLSVYSDQVGAWAPDAADSGLCAAVLSGASMALGGLKRQARIDNLQIALESNRTIGAAVGIVMSTQRCTSEQAFALITATSQNGNVKLRDVAEDVLRVGNLSIGPTTYGPDPASSADDPLGLPTHRDTLSASVTAVLAVGDGSR